MILPGRFLKKAKVLALYATIGAAAIGAAGNRADANMIVNVVPETTIMVKGYSYKVDLVLNTTEDSVKAVKVHSQNSQNPKLYELGGSLEEAGLSQVLCGAGGGGEELREGSGHFA